MTEAKSYIFKQRSIVFDSALALMLIALLIYLLISAFHSPLGILLIGAVPAVFLYFQIQTIRIAAQFNKYDAGKEITINAERSVLTLTTDEKSTAIEKDEVERVELYEQKDIGKFGRYSYVVIYAGEKTILITNFTIPLLLLDKVLESFLSKKPRTYFKRNFNFIDEKKFGV